MPAGRRGPRIVRLRERLSRNRTLSVSASTDYFTELFLCSDVYVSRGLSMAKADSLQGSMDLLVLKILSRRPGLHGYAIMSAIQDISGEVLRAEEGSLYPALHRMEETGWIRAKWITKDTGRRTRLSVGAAESGPPGHFG